MDTSYAEVGTEIVICFHRPERYVQEVQKYVCKKTVITEVVNEPPAVCHVKIDGGFYWWPIDDMILASDIDLLTPEQRERIR